MGRAAPVTVVIPMKALAVSKLRLASVLGPEQRAVLSLMLLQQTISVAKGSPSVSNIKVIGGDAYVRSLAEEAGACWLDDKGQGLTKALAFAFQKCCDEGAEGSLFIPADLPFLTPRDVEGLVWTSNGLRNLVLAPALRDKGTNALLVPKGLPFQPMLGESSFFRHLAQVQVQRFPAAVYTTPGLGFDLDTPEDLKVLAARVPSLWEQLTALKDLAQGYISQSMTERGIKPHE